MNPCKFARQFLALLAWAIVPLAASAQNILLQPYYGTASIRAFPSQEGPVGTPLYTIDLSNDMEAAWPGITGGLNAVAVHGGRVFASFDMNFQAGGVIVYNWADVYPARSANPPLAVLKPGGGGGGPSAGMAFQPSTGDLFVATFQTGGFPGGVWRSTAASGYSTITNFSNFNDDQSVAETSANLAFDAAGNLWMSTWSPDNQPDHHFLICYKGASRNSFYKWTNPAMPSYKDADNPGGPSYHLFSAPEGLAFDQSGNLYLGNNNDGYRTNNAGDGTFVRISASWIASALAGATGNANQAPIPAAAVELHRVPGAKFGGVMIAGHYLYVSDQGRNQGPNPDASGTVWRWDLSRPFGTGWVESGIHSTYPGNGNMALLRPEGLLIRDHLADQGFEPNTGSPSGWESPDIWVQPGAGGLGDGVNVPVDGGRPCRVYVRVRNTGLLPGTGSANVRLYWAKASSGLGWPVPWDGVPIAGFPAMGGQVGITPLGAALAPGAERIVFFDWTAPDPKTYSMVFGAEDGHFCLLARVETSPTAPWGLRFPEQGGASASLIQNVRSNSPLAWRNVHVRKLSPTSGVGILVANHSLLPLHARVSLELLGADGLPLAAGSGRMTVRAEGRALEDLLHADFNREALRPLEDGLFEVIDPATALDHLQLPPGGLLPMLLQFEPGEEMKGYAIRATQWAYTDSGLEVVGGQTFVSGEVAGFSDAPPAGPAPEEPPAAEKQCWLGWPCWLWIVAGVVVLLALALLLMRRRK